MAVNITTDTNTVKVTSTATNKVSIVDNKNNTSVSVSQPTTRVIKVATIGPQGPTGAIPNTGSFATTGSNTFIGTQTITGSNGRLVYTGTTPGTYPTLAEIHANDDYPWLHRFYNDTFSTSSAIVAYFGYNDGRFVFHNESTQSIGLQVNGYNAENGLLVYSDKVAFVNNVVVTGSLNVSGSITGSLFGTASHALTSSNVQGGTANYIPIWNTATSLSSSAIYQSAGNIGIGTTALTQKFNVYGGAGRFDNIGTQLILGTQGTAGAYEFAVSTGNALSISLSGVNERMRIDSSGNVGINTTTPNAKLDVNGSTIITGSLTTKGPSTSATTASLLVQNSNASSSMAVFGSNLVRIYSPTNNSSLTLSSDDNNAYLGTSGIGAHISMAIGTNTTYYSQAGFFSSGVEIKGSPWYGYVLNLDKGIYVADDYLRFGTGSINSSGSLSLGKTSATAKLDVSGSVFITGSLGITGSITQVGIQIVTGSTRGNVIALSITSNTASVDLSAGNFFTLQLVSGSNTYINPSNILPGQTSMLTLSTTGSATVSFPSSIKQPSGSAYIPTTTTGIDILTLASVDSSTLYVVNIKNMI